MATTQPQASAPAASRGINGLALPALIASFFISFLGIVLGHLSLEQIRATGDSGRGLAIAALAVGYVTVCLTGLALVMYFAIAASRLG